MDNLKKTWYCWLQSIVELIIYFPVFFVPAYLLFDTPNWIYWLIGVTLAYVFGFWVTRMLQGQMIGIIFAALFIPVILVGLLLFSPVLAKLATIVAYGTAALRGYQYVIKDSKAHFPTVAYWSGLILYIVAYVMTLFFDRNQEYPFLLYFTLAGAAAILLTLLLGNFRLLISEHKAKKGLKAKTSSQMLTHNQVFIAVFFLICLCLASLGSLGDFFSGLQERIMAWLERMANRESGGAPDLGSSESEGGLPEAGESAEWLSNLDSILIYVVMVVLAVAFVALIIFAIKKFKVLAAWMNKWMKKKRTAAEEEDEVLGYVDEEESLFDLKKSAKSVLDRFSKWFEREEKVSDYQTNAEKVRFLYRFQIFKALQKGYAFKAQLTPKETADDLADWNQQHKLQDELVQAYNNTRYGGQEPDRSIVEKIKNQLGLKE